MKRKKAPSPSQKASPSQERRKRKTIPKVEVIETKVKGFDEILGGGLPKASSILLQGPPGTFKSILSFEVLYNVAQEQYVGLLVLTESDPLHYLAEMKSLGFDVDSFLRRVNVLNMRTWWKDKVYKEYEWALLPQDVTENVKNPSVTIREAIRKTIEDFNTRDVIVVIDSISHFFLGAPVKGRQIVDSIIATLQTYNVTSILVSQTTREGQAYGGVGVEHMTDGVVSTSSYWLEGEKHVTIRVEKLRGLPHSWYEHPMKIVDGQVVIEYDKKFYVAGGKPHVVQITLKRKKEERDVEGELLELLKEGNENDSVG